MQLIYYQNSLVSLVRYQALIPLLFSDETEQGYGPKYYTVFPCTHSDSSPYLTSWPNGLHTRLPCAVERDAPSDRGSTRPGRVRLPKNYF